MKTANHSTTIDLTPSPVFGSLGFSPTLEEKITDPLYHILFFQHFNAPGSNCYITLGKKHITGKWFQRNFKPSEIEDGLNEFGKTNVFFSMNNFYIPFRQEKWIKEIRALYVDLDFYKMKQLKGFSAEMLRQKVDLEFVDEGIIPAPNGTVFSGNGLQLIWLIEPVAGIKQSAKRLWSKLQQKFCELLADLGADPQAIDIPRVFRVAGTVNHKEEHGSKPVYMVHHHTDLYSMSQLADDFLPELTTRIVNKKQSNKRKKSKGKVKNLFNGYSLNMARMEDLEALTRLRNGQFPKMRQFAVWLYRIFALQAHQNPVEALNLAKHFNDHSLAVPLPADEVKWHTHSAEKKWLQEKDKKGDNGFVCGYSLSNEKIIEILAITMDEQKQMNTIIGKKEKSVRNHDAHEKYRRNKGQVPRSTYLRNSTDKKKDVLENLIQKHPNATIRELALMSGISVGRVHQLKSELQR